MTLITSAFIIKKKDYKDADKITTLLTKDLGKISALGKFAKKSLKRNLNLLDFGFLLKIKLNYNQRNDIYFIEQATLEECFLSEPDYLKFLVFSFVSELLFYTVYGGEESSKIFEETLAFFKSISETDTEKTKNIWSMLTIYKIKLLELIGYKIETEKCTVCNKDTETNNYSLEKIGFICNNCRKNNDTLPVYKGTKKILGNMNKNIILSREIISQLNTIFDANIKKIVSVNGYNKIKTLGNIIENGI